MRKIAYLGLGSNLGDRMKNILDGLDQLDARTEMAVRRVSTIIETEPVGVDGHDRYLNAVAEIETSCSSAELISACQEVEHVFGRVHEPGGPRPRRLDVDLLLLGDEVVDEPGVCVPHPRMHQRAFVLVPLVELKADLLHPVLKRTVQHLLEQEIELNGPVEERCAILKPGSLLADESAAGPAGLEPG